MEVTIPAAAIPGFLPDSSFDWIQPKMIPSILIRIPSPQQQQVRILRIPITSEAIAKPVENSGGSDTALL